ncbi:MAG TPA: hypothetical protein VKI18_03075 [Albitalea sp.]|nr:hypothetical protein [Albitalea sp.]
MNVLSSITLQGSPRTTPPRLAAPIGRAVAQAYGSIVAQLASWLRPRTESPAEAAARLRALADQYRDNPSHAADLRAAADRHDNFGQE